MPQYFTAPNVSQGYYDWGSNYSDVINVGVLTEASNGELLSSEATLPTLDILADGIVEKSGWGENFWTSSPHQKWQQVG